MSDFRKHLEELMQNPEFAKEYEKLKEQNALSNHALEYAIIKHKGQMRSDKKTPYINHPVRVASLVEKYKQSHMLEELKAAAYLHDVLEQTDATYYELVEGFGFCVASLVMELTTIEEMKDAIGKPLYLAYKLKHMTSWALVIKLCDRLDNISDMEGFSDKKKESYIRETITIIEYLLRNRELSDTHKRIITDIQAVIDKYHGRFE